MTRTRLSFAVVFLIFAGGCGTPAETIHTTAEANPSVAASQGLTAAERERFYHLDLGSELFPLAWLQVLQSKQTGKPFLEDIERFGLIPDPANPEGLPVGLTAAESRQTRLAGKMVGMNCCVCHVGELTCQGKRFRIDGGPSLFQVDAFVGDMIASAVATAESPGQLLAFIKRLFQNREYARVADATRPKGSSLLRTITSIDVLNKAGDLKTVKTSLNSLEEDAVALKEALGHVSETIQLLKARVKLMQKLKGEQNVATTPPGPGRADDFGTARNVLFDAQFARPTTAPCRIPSLWGEAGALWTDYDGNTQSSLGRSMATALAAGATFDPATFASTVPPQNLLEMETLSRKITPPAWPKEILGKIDPAKAQRGATIFAQQCARCHTDGKSPPPDLLFSLEEIGTDPARALNYAAKLGEREFADALREAVANYLDRACRDNGIDHQELAEQTAARPNNWRTTKKYAPRPLLAVWTKAPYLHNGSVPTLHDLLLPAAQRPKTFPVGQRKYDPVKLGYVTQVDGPTRFMFDTSLPGNGNAGHEFGTSLSDQERMDLLEYLKAI